MCGRYASFRPPEAIARLFRTGDPLPNVDATWNLAPSQDALVVRRHPETGERRLNLLRWGLLPHFTKDPAHARRPPALPRRDGGDVGHVQGRLRSAPVPGAGRCVLRVEGRVQGGKQPFAIARVDGQPMAFAGLWEGFRWPDGDVTRTFTIITTDANAKLAELHDRMPVVLEEADWSVWLGEAEGDPKLLLRPPQEEALRLWPVSRQVNTPRNDGPDLLAPLVDPGGVTPAAGANPA
jgi:putative SOS response-associated peptidase YedK